MSERGREGVGSMERGRKGVWLGRKAGMREWRVVVRE